jgi:hypothetical protein
MYPSSEPIEVRPVRTRKDLDRFIRLPWRIYADDPSWVPPLWLERRLHFSSLNPFFKHAEWRAWIAYLDGQPVGRISAQIDHTHRKRYGQHTGHFGLLESINDQRVVAALTQASEDWLSDRHAKQITGPFNFSINQDCGILVDGFDTPPVVLMPHSRRWYGQMLENQGYRPAMDLLAYWINTDFEPSQVMSSLAKRYARRIHLRKLRRNRFGEEMEIMRDIFNDAWSQNWGFLPFSKEEFSDLGNSLRMFIPDEFVQIAELDGAPAGFVVLLPNLNEVLKELNGSLLPFGWLNLLKRVRKGDITTGRMPLMGVRRQHQNSPLGIALAFTLCDTLRRYALANTRIKGVEMSWILENNKGMRSILDNIGSKEYKRYRIYDKSL